MKSRRCAIRLSWLGLLLLVASTMGCGRGLYPVKGQVVYKDGSDVSVLAKGKVLFSPANPDMERISPRGEIQPDGTFQMSTYASGDGVKPGKYRVMVTQPIFFPKSRGEQRPVLLDERFASFDTSGLEITVTGPIDDYTITVEKP
jgi:hypothetical protein